MNRKVLLVDPAAASREASRLALGEAYGLHVAEDAAQALALCERHGPFAAAVSDQHLPDLAGIELLSRLQRGWPDTSRILRVPRTELGLAIEALHQARIFRILAREEPAEALREAVLLGVTRFQEVELERLATEQLMFSRESLLGLTGILERRLDDQVDRMRELQHLVTSLTRAGSVGEVVQIAASGCSGLLGGRSVQVHMEDSSSACTHHGRYGGEPSSEVVSQPVFSPESEIGRIELDRLSPRGEHLSEHDQRILDSLAAYAGFAADNLIRRRERDEAQHSTIYALARLAENRDDETGQHLDRVSGYCRLIAEGLMQDGYPSEELNEAFVSDLMMSAPLHDIGKVGIPDAILHKPGNLTEDEWTVMRRHTIIGAETLRHVLETSGEQSFLRMGHDIALYHHERWDGSGYPHGLGGEEIPLAARIASIADCYDALTTWRPYKDPWLHEEALAYIEEQRGTQFDPALVDAFVRRAKQADRIRRELADDGQGPEPHRQGAA